MVDDQFWIQSILEISSKVLSFTKSTHVLRNTSWDDLVGCK